MAWEKIYLDGLNRCDETGEDIEARKEEHRRAIQWFQHRITNLKDPGPRVKSLTVGVNTNEKKLNEANAAREAAKLVLEDAQTKYDASLAKVEAAATAFHAVKLDLEAAEKELADEVATKLKSQAIDPMLAELIKANVSEEDRAEYMRICSLAGKTVSSPPPLMPLQW